jgi:hypothetical protein
MTSPPTLATARQWLESGSLLRYCDRSVNLVLLIETSPLGNVEMCLQELSTYRSQGKQEAKADMTPECGRQHVTIEDGYVRRHPTPMLELLEVLKELLLHKRDES